VEDPLSRRIQDFSRRKRNDAASIAQGRMTAEQCQLRRFAIDGDANVCILLFDSLRRPDHDVIHSLFIDVTLMVVDDFHQRTTEDVQHPIRFRAACWFSLGKPQRQAGESRHIG